MAPSRLIAALAGAAALLTLAPAWAGSLVVLTVKGAPARVAAPLRNKLVEALSSDPQLELRKVSDYRALARRQHVRGDPEARAQVPKLAKAAGVDAVLVAQVRKGRLEAELVDARGRRRWAGSYALADKRAPASVASHVGQVLDAAPVSGATPSGAAPASVAPDLTSAPAPKPAVVAAVSGRAQLPDPSVVAAPAAVHDPGEAASAPRGEVVARAPEPRRHDDDAEALPLLQLSAGAPVSLRTYASSPAKGSAVDYQTAVPYAGVAAQVEVTPLHSDDSPLRGLGARLAAQRGQLHTRLETPGASQVLSSSDTRIALDALYRYELPLDSPWRPRVGASVGAGLHLFSVDPNPALPGSSRRGLRLGLEVSQPVVPGWVRATLAGRALPLYGPGAAERAAFGETASGYGLEAALGAEGRLPGPVDGLGWSLALNYTRYADQFQSGAARGSAVETYRGLLAQLTYAL